MKIDRIRKNKKSGLELNITPLVDVVFLLLIFFLVATNFDNRGGIKIELPQSSIMEVEKIKDIQIIVNPEKQIFIVSGKENVSEIEKSDLSRELIEKFKISDSKNVIISSDKSVDFGFIVEIMSIAKESGAIGIDIDTKY